MPYPTPRKPLNRPVRILIVEDNRADADLMILHLRRSGMELEARVVQDEPGFRRALADFEPDVVLADNHLPRFSGRRALRIVRHTDPLLPVIMVTGTLREDRVIRLGVLGLVDYVLKDRLLRLTPSVVHALDRAAEQRQAIRDRAALEASERRFRAVAEASGDALAVVDQEGRVVFWNAAAEKLFGYASAEMLGRDVAALVPQGLRDRHESGWRNALDGGSPIRPFTQEVSALRADGTEFPVELTVSSWEEDGARFFSAQVRDITQRKEEARFRYVLSEAVEQTVTSVVITDTSGAIEYVNPAFESLTGYTLDEVRGKTPRVLKSGKQPLERYRRLWADVAAGRTFNGEFINRRKDGSEYHQRTIIFPIHSDGGEVERFVGLGQDVTQERLMESQFHQAQKMEAVGQLAGGIAHDFNNILTGVLTNAQLLEMVLAEKEGEEREYVADILSAARRGGDLVRRLMTLARSETAPASRVDIRGVVDEAMKTVRRILPETIELSVEHPDEELFCHLDEGGLHQALFNLATNARDAMPDGGRLSVRTRRVIDAALGGTRVPCALVDVRDNGTGMDAATRARIFEPFFTTKQAGKGTGLGLAMVYSFVTRLAGEVWVESVPGAGTTFSLALPLKADRDAVEVPEPGEHPTTAETSQVGAGTVLIAEDQEDIRRVAEKVLTRMGYRVLTASDGAEAMMILGRERARVDLVLADLVMPRGGGGMLYRNTAGWSDRPAFLFMSGYAQSELNGDEVLLQEVPFLAKPFTIDALQTAVRSALSAA